MNDMREEVMEINHRCAELGITGLVLSVSDVASITGWSKVTARRKFRFGGPPGSPSLTRSQLARQLVELSCYRAATI